MRWLTNFYDFRFKWKPTAAIKIYPTKSWLSQLVNFKNAIRILEERYSLKFCFKLGKNAMWWNLDLLLWPRDQETEFPVEACWLSQTQEGQTVQIHPQTFDDPFFWQHWHVEGDQKASFSITTTPRCRGGRYSFPWIGPLYPWYPYIAEC